MITIGDKAANGVSDATSGAILVYVDKQAVPVQQIRSLSEEPLIFSMVIDTSGSTRQFAEQQIAAATKLFQALSIGTNRGYLILFGVEVATTDRFMEPQKVEQILKQVPSESRRGATSLYDAVVHACREQLNSSKIPRNSRRAIFVFSDGGDNTSRHSLFDTIKIAQIEGIPIFSIGSSMRGASESRRDQKREFSNLEALSRETGGWVTFLGDSHDFVGHLPDLLHGQYLLTFSLANFKHKKSYALKLEPSAKDAHVLSPAEYFSR